ncbi:MAG: hypothetical protein GXY55_15090 [Phycisphaerae bacterium]|nr:hypothetical protein [Phycisphaerae bacterium]
MRLGPRLVTLRNWLYLIGSGSFVAASGMDCLPTTSDIQAAVASNVLGAITAIVDAIFLSIGNALLNPITPGIIG